MSNSRKKMRSKSADPSRNENPSPAPPPAVPTHAPVQRVTMDDLRSMAGEYHVVKVAWFVQSAGPDGEPRMTRKVVAIEVRRLTAAESAAVQDWVEKALPPVIPPATPADPPRYNFNDAEYVKSHRTNASLARALALYHGVKLFRESYDEARGDKPFAVAEFRDWLEQQAPETVLTKLLEAVSVNDAEEEEKARLFT